HPGTAGPRWAARMRARAQERAASGDGNGRGQRGVRRFAVFRVASRAQELLAFVRDWAEGSVAHLRADVATARREIASAARAMGRGTVLTATGAVLALLGGFTLLAGVVMLLGDQWLPRDWYWLAALILGVLAGGIALWSAGRGRALLGRGLAPEQTLASLREDRDAVERALT
ncbi:MAG TPA: phage holin family protein, partial [Gemmatimonadaceae bacterium]|nr:phage holin family protein [Gemmatimonadaceae bacterium]